jgi:hypothetical protein
LETTGLVINVAEIADARSIVPNSEEEKRANRFEKVPRLVGGQTPGWEEGAQPCPEERLTSVYIADPADHLLIEEQHFYGDGAGSAEADEPTSIDIFLDRVTADTCKFGNFRTLMIDMEGSEDPKVIIEQGGSAFHVKNEADVLVIGDGAPEMDDEFPCHTQMDNQAVATFEMKVEKFAFALHTNEGLSLQSMTKFLYPMEHGDLFMPHLYRSDGLPGDESIEASDNCFDFGKFRHRLRRLRIPTISETEVAFQAAQLPVKSAGSLIPGHHFEIEFSDFKIGHGKVHHLPAITVLSECVLDIEMTEVHGPTSTIGEGVSDDFTIIISENEGNVEPCKHLRHALSDLLIGHLIIDSLIGT